MKINVDSLPVHSKSGVLKWKSVYIHYQCIQNLAFWHGSVAFDTGLAGALLRPLTEARWPIRLALSAPALHVLPEIDFRLVVRRTAILIYRCTPGIWIIYSVYKIYSINKIYKKCSIVYNIGHKKLGSLGQLIIFNIYYRNFEIFIEFGKINIYTDFEK